MGNSCPHCGSVEVEFIEYIDVHDQVDEDLEWKYFAATALFVCLHCEKDFTAEDTYKEKNIIPEEDLYDNLDY